MEEIRFILAYSDNILILIFFLNINHFLIFILSRKAQLSTEKLKNRFIDENN